MAVAVLMAGAVAVMVVVGTAAAVGVGWLGGVVAVAVVVLR
jgi:hypothetical protein